MTIDELRNSKVVQLWPIAMLRVYTGIFILDYGFGKLRRDNFADGMAGFLNAQLESTLVFYRPFVEGVVLPNKGLFAVLVS